MNSYSGSPNGFYPTIKAYGQVRTSELKKILEYATLSCYPLKRKALRECSEIIRDILNNTVSWRSLRYIGKGTTSIVYAINDSMALKLARTDSQADMTREGIILLRIQYMAPQFRLAPKVYSFTRKLLLMEMIKGITLEEALERNILEKKHIAWMLEKSLILDELNIRHNELSRPYRHVLLLGKVREPMFIDFYNATLGRKGSFTKLLSGLIFSNNRASRKIRKILGIREKDLHVLINLAKEYKRGVLKTQETKKTLNRILGITTVHGD